MKASEEGHWKVVKALADEYGADINIKNNVSCVHQPELILLLGVACVVCTTNSYITAVMMVVC